jgi:pilus assembly protein CpaC
MAFYIFAVLTTFSIISSATAPLHLELGEYFYIKKRFSKIWIENKSQIEFRQKENLNYLRASKIGVSHLRLDNELYKVIVSPIGTKIALAEWQTLKNKFTGVTAELCGELPCLSGTLYSSQDFLKILDLIKKYDQVMYLRLRPTLSAEQEIRKLLEIKFRDAGLTPHKINFSPIWSVRVPQTNANVLKLQKLGLFVESDDTKLSIADNVKISVKIIELRKNQDQKLGIHWPDSFDAQVLNFSNLQVAETFDIALAAAEKSGNAKILASPNIICRSGKEADFFAGGEFPVKIITAKSKETQWKRYGIGLKFKPQVDAIGQMSLHIETEISTLDRSITVDDTPALYSNRVTSYFDLINEKTIALSGLIQSQVSESFEGLPFLKNLPILGRLFSSKNFQENKSEFIIFVTPKLMQQYGG